MGIATAIRTSANRLWTDLTLPTNKQGIMTTRGFLGDYKIKVTAEGKTVEFDLKLAKDAKPIELIMP